MTKANLQWLAGFWEGEGSAGSYWYKSHYKTKTYAHFYLQASLAQNDRQILKWVQKSFGGHLYKNDSISSCYRLVWNGKPAKEFLSAILPFIKMKRRLQQIKAAIAKGRV